MAAEPSPQLPEERLPHGQFNLFTGELEPLPIEIPEPREPGETQVDEGITLVKTEDSSQLVLSGYGLFLRKKSERLLVKKGDNLIYQFPFFRLNEVVIASRGIALSSDLIEELCERGVRVSFLDNRGQPYALLSSPMLSATVHARREQLLAFHDGRGLAFAQAVVSGKIANQERLLRYFGKYMKKADPGRFQAIEQAAKALKAQHAKATAVQGNCIDEARDSLMGIEGLAGRLYWEGRECARSSASGRSSSGGSTGGRRMRSIPCSIMAMGSCIPRCGARCSTRGWNRSPASCMSIGQGSPRWSSIW